MSNPLNIALSEANYHADILDAEYDKTLAAIEAYTERAKKLYRDYQWACLYDRDQPDLAIAAKHALDEFLEISEKI